MRVLRPLFHAFLFLILGQTAAVWIAPPPAALFAALGLALVWLAWLLRRATDSQGLRPACGTLCLAAFALVGAINQTRIERQDGEAGRLLAQLASGGKARIEGRIDGAPQQRGESLTLVLRRLAIEQSGETWRPSGGLRLSLRDGAHEWALSHTPLSGQILRCEAELEPPQAPSNPGEFDFRAYLRSQGLAAAATLWSDYRLEIEEPAGGPGWFDTARRAAARAREEAARAFARGAGRERTDLFRSMLFGESYRLAPERREAFARAGMAHWFAVSGLHAGLAALTLFLVLRLFGVPPRASWPLMALGVWAFAALAEFRPPVVRAAIMASAAAAAPLLGRRGDALNSLALAGMAVLLVSPRSLWKSDFQLSYACVFGLIALWPGAQCWLIGDISRLKPRWRPWAMGYNRWLAGPLMVSLLSQLALAPLLARYYGQISIVAPLANLAAAPFGFLAVFAGFGLAVFGPWIEPLAFGLAWICRASLAAVEAIGQGFGSLPFASAAASELPWWAAGAYYAVLYFGPHARAIRAPGDRERARSALAIRLAAAIAILVWGAGFAPRGGVLLARILDVGQGDSIYVELPGGQNMLIDGGPSSRSGGSAGRWTVLPYLRSRGIERLNLLAATHADSDHIGGLADVVRAIRVERAIVGPSEADSEAGAEFERALNERGVLRIEVARGDRVEGFEGASLAVLNPPREGSFADDDNNRSLVLRLDCGEFSILFPGDAGAEAERAMLEAGAPLDCDFAMAAHHGSRSSSSLSFLQAVSPLAVFISCGMDNQYGHPHAETLERIERSGARAVFRTDLDGSIAVFSRDGEAWVETQRAADGSNRKSTRFSVR